jgi:hypothetical protein
MRRKTKRLLRRSLMIIGAGLLLLILLGLIFSPQILHKVNAASRIGTEYACGRLSCEDIPGVIEPNLKTYTYLQEEYENALGREDYHSAARINSYMAHESMTLLDSFSGAWIDQRDPATGLIPYRLTWGDEYNLYLPEQSAADFYPFLIISSYMVNESRFREVIRWLDVEEEYRFEEGFPGAVDLVSGDVFEKNLITEYDLERKVFATSEVMKDGYLPLINFFGDEIYLDKTEEQADLIFSMCLHETEYGCVPSLSTEVNGEFLMTLARMQMMTGEQKYMEYGQPIFDLYMKGVLPENDYIPCSLDAELSCTGTFNAGDHDSEIIPGLVEFYYAKKHRLHDMGEYTAPMMILLNNVRSSYITEDGFWPRTYNSRTPYVDTWAYLHSAYDLFSDIENYDADFVQSTLTNLAEMKIQDFAWSPDGIADAIEGTLYLFWKYRKSDTRKWIDRNIYYLYAQDKNGMYEFNYRDGNVARTLIMYSLYKTGGVQLRPWREDLRLGAHRDGDSLYVYISSEGPWSGQLVFDTNRTMEQMGVDYYPRINSFPEWFAIDEEHVYTVVRDDESIAVDPSVLTDGYGISVDGETHFTVTS